MKDNEIKLEYKDICDFKLGQNDILDRNFVNG